LVTGVYLVVFGSCVYLLTRRNIAWRKLLAVSSALFLLATADIIITLYFFFHFVIQHDLATTGTALQQKSLYKSWNEPLKIKFGFYVVAKYVQNPADFLESQVSCSAVASGLSVGLKALPYGSFSTPYQVHRCYEVWRNKRVVIAPIALIVVGTGISVSVHGLSASDGS